MYHLQMSKITIYRLSLRTFVEDNGNVYFMYSGTVAKVTTQTAKSTKVWIPYKTYKEGFILYIISQYSRNTLNCAIPSHNGSKLD